MRPITSFLLGSGFSKPEGIPGVVELNKRLSKINRTEFAIYGNQRAEFLKGKPDPTGGTRIQERVFAEEFLEFYNSRVIKGQAFNYEDFFDFYHSYLVDRANKEEIENFHKDFISRNGNYADCLNSVASFNRTFQQLVAELLHSNRYLNDASVANYPLYGGFIGFILELLKANDIKIHTLNHDLFMDWLGRTHIELWQHFSDGYQLEGSPYYGTVSYHFNREIHDEVYKTYHVKLEHFTNKYDKPICLFKLHGSIFNTIVFPPPSRRPVRLKYNYFVSDFYQETYSNGEYAFETIIDEVAPDFLSGRTNKIRLYSDDPYYAILLKHFKDNLALSEKLIVVGYGFQDTGVNECLEEQFLSKGKQMIVISPHKPITDLIDKYAAKYIPKGVTDLSYTDWVTLGRE